MVAQFNFTPLRTGAIALVKYFGRHTQFKVLRTVDGAAPDAAKPWRVGSPSLLEFPFTGVLITLAMPRMGNPDADGVAELYAPGDLPTVAALTAPGTLCGMPLLTDRIYAGGKQYAILGIQDISSDQTLLIKMRVKAWPQLTSQPSTGF